MQKKISETSKNMTMNIINNKKKTIFSKLLLHYYSSVHMRLDNE